MTYWQVNRYKTGKKQTYNNQKFDSGFEASYAIELDLRKRAGEITGWEAHVPIDLIVNGYKIATYKIDFVVHYPDGITEYVETKGYAHDVWKLKWKIFEALYSEKPDVKITLVKQRNNFNLRKIKKVKTL